MNKYAEEHLDTIKIGQEKALDLINAWKNAYRSRENDYKLQITKIEEQHAIEIAKYNEMVAGKDATIKELKEALDQITNSVISFNNRVITSLSSEVENTTPKKQLAEVVTK